MNIWNNEKYIIFSRSFFVYSIEPNHFILTINKNHCSHDNICLLKLSFISLGQHKKRYLRVKHY